MSVNRVRYRERQPLRAVDLDNEQAYRLAMRRWHNIAYHGWGIVQGLEVVVEEGGLVVKAGMAVDGYGRELIVPEPVSIPDDVFDQLESEAVDVWLVYGRVAETPPQRGRWECGPGRHTRWREEARLRLIPANGIDHRRPIEVSDADLDFGPHETPPDDPEQEWPIYLGQITRTSTDLTNRPYVTLVGELIVAPSSRARMQVGSELTGDRLRFAVSLPDEDGTFTDWIAIDRDGRATLRGNVTLEEGNLILADAGPDVVWGVEFGPLTTPPDAAAPWQIYRTVTAQDEVPINQLRLEIGHPGDKGDPTRYRLVVGYTSDASEFVPCLSVAADCNVTLHGNLVPEGQVIEGPIRADPDDPRFGAALLNRWVRGLAGAGSQLDTFYAGELAVEIEAPSSVSSGATLSYTVTVRNTGRGSVTDIQVHENLAVNDKVHRQEAIVRDLTLGPAASRDIERTFDVPSGAEGEISVAVTALGVGPAGNVISASASAIVEIAESEQPIG